MITNIPGLLTSRVGNIRGTIISLNESTETCVMKFDGNIIKKDIPMKSVYINEGFIDTLKRGLKGTKQAIDFVVKKFKGLFVPIINGVRDMVTAYSSPSNWIQMQKQGLIPEGVGIDAMGQDNGVIDKEDEIVTQRGVDEFEAYMYRVIKEYDKDPNINVDDAVKNAMNESFIAFNSKRRIKKSLNESINNAMVVSLSDPTAFGGSKTFISSNDQLMETILGVINTTINDPIITRNTAISKLSPSNSDDNSSANSRRRMNADELAFYEPDENEINKVQKELTNEKVTPLEEQYRMMNTPVSISDPIIHPGADKPYLIWGAPGIGKTASVANAVKFWNAKNPHKKLSFLVVDVGSLRGSDLILPNIDTARVGITKKTTKDKEDEDKFTYASIEHKDTGTFDQYTASWLPVVDTTLCNTLEERYELERCINKGMTKSQSRNNGSSIGTASEVEDNEILANRDDYWGGILFLDEISRISDTGLRTFIMNLVNGRSFNNKVMASNWIIIAASNRIYDVSPDVQESITSIMGESAKTSRFSHLIYTLPFKEWFKWAKGKNSFGNNKPKIDPVILDFFESLKNDETREKVYYPTIDNGGYESQIANVTKRLNTDEQSSLLTRIQAIKDRINSPNQQFTKSELLDALGIKSAYDSTDDSLFGNFDVTDVKGFNPREWTKLSNNLAAFRNNLTVFGESQFTDRDNDGDLIDPNDFNSSWRSIDELFDYLWGREENGRTVENGLFTSWSDTNVGDFVTTARVIIGALNDTIRGLNADYNNKLGTDKDDLAVDENKWPTSVKLLQNYLNAAKSIIDKFNIPNNNLSAEALRGLAVYCAINNDEFNVDEFLDYYFGRWLLPLNLDIYSEATIGWNDAHTWRVLYNNPKTIDSLVKTGYYPSKITEKEPYKLQQKIKENFHNIIDELNEGGVNITTLVSKNISDNAYNVADNFVGSSGSTRFTGKSSLRTVAPLFEWKNSLSTLPSVINLIVKSAKIDVPKNDLTPQQERLDDIFIDGVQTVEEFMHTVEYMLSLTTDFASNTELIKLRNKIIQTKDVSLVSDFNDKFYEAFNALDEKLKHDLRNFYGVNPLDAKSPKERGSINDTVAKRHSRNIAMSFGQYVTVSSKGEVKIVPKYAQYLKVKPLTTMLANMNTHIFNVVQLQTEPTITQMSKVLYKTVVLTPESVQSNLESEFKPANNPTLGGNPFWTGMLLTYYEPLNLICSQRGQQLLTMDFSKYSLTELLKIQSVFNVLIQLTKNFDFYKFFVNIHALILKYSQEINSGNHGGTKGAGGSQNIPSISKIFTQFTGLKLDRLGLLDMDDKKAAFGLMYSYFIMPVLHTSFYERTGMNMVFNVMND